MEIVRYYINGTALDSLGIYISQSDGLVDIPKPKSRYSHDWYGYSGKQYFLETENTFEERDITLNCFILAENWNDIIVVYKKFLDWFYDDTGIKRLMVFPFGYYPLVFDVLLKDKISIDKRFSKGKMYGIFSLKFVEPSPIKQIYRTKESEPKFNLQSPGIWTTVNRKDYIGTLSGEDVESVSGNIRIGNYDNGFKGVSDQYFMSIVGDGVMSITTDNQTSSPIWRVIDDSGNEFGLMQDEFQEDSNVIMPEEFYLVFDIRASSNFNAKTVELRNSTKNVISNGQNIELTEEWKTITLKCKQDNQGKVGQFKIIAETGSDDWFEIKNIKLQLRKNEMAWKPSVADWNYIVVSGQLRDISITIPNSERIL